MGLNRHHVKIILKKMIQKILKLIQDEFFLSIYTLKIILKLEIVNTDWKLLEI